MTSNINEGNSFDRSLLTDRDTLHELYWNPDPSKCLSLSQIAKLISVSKTTVNRTMRKFDIPIRSSAETHRLKQDNRDLSLLDDFAKLRELYWNEDESKRLNMSQIAKLVGCTRQTVFYAFKKHGIPRRDYSEAKFLLYRKTTTTGLNLSVLKDSNKLHDLYWNVDENRRLSIRQIAKMTGMKYGTIRQAMIKYEIPLRDSKEGLCLRVVKKIPLTTDLLQFLDGSMLGDGYLYPQARSSRYCLTTKFFQYAKYVKKLFTENDYTAKIYSQVDKRYDIEYYQVYSCATVQLNEYRKKWYPSGEKRIIEDLILTPTICMHWYLEDGSLRLGKKRKRVKRYVFDNILLSTQGFKREGNIFLVESLKKVLNVKEGVLIDKDNTIRFNKKLALKFLEYIGNKAPIKCFEYKFNPAMKPPKPGEQKGVMISST
ncbi:MAG: hypothetical protein ACXADA_24080 [Candidatus Hodarchaeales archaeon]